MKFHKMRKVTVKVLWISLPSQSQENSSKDALSLLPQIVMHCTETWLIYRLSTPLVTLLPPSHASHMKSVTITSCDVQWPSRNLYSIYQNKCHSYDSSTAAVPWTQTTHGANSNQTVSWKRATKHLSTIISILYPPPFSDLQTGSRYWKHAGC